MKLLFDSLLVLMLVSMVLYPILMVGLISAEQHIKRTRKYKKHNSMLMNVKKVAS